jgi:quercetin dioxygenase-like cupin family protein
VKIAPGCKIAQHKLKRNMLSIFVMNGSVRVEVDGESSVVKPFGFYNVVKDSDYSYSNVGKDTAVMMITRS